jgi:Flp pilus assembly protein TadG
MKTSADRTDAPPARRKAAILLEFALIFPILLILLLGMLEFSTVYFVRHAMLHAAREAARGYAIGEFDSAQAQAFAANALPGIQIDFTVEVSPDPSSDVERWVQISAPMNQASLGDPLNVLNAQDLTVRVSMRREE